LPKIKPNLIDMVFADLPYGTTQNKWDSIIPLDQLWQLIRCCSKITTPFVFTAQIPFSIALGTSNLGMLKYEWIWQKERGTGHLNSKIQPQKDHENVLVFYEKQCVYNPQMREGKAYTAIKGGLSNNYRGDSKDVIVTVNNGDRYPLTVIKFQRDKDKLHPTQKPVALLEYLVRTYTNEGDLVLDPTMGSGTTGVACLNTNRRFIGIEKDKDIFDQAVNRIQEHVSK
jgi:site-specific DNA-methyltransferase (adenine-specific)